MGISTKGRAKKKRRRSFSGRYRRLALERFEDRRLLAIVAWDGGGDGTNWSDAFNWDGDQLPAAADDVVLDVAGDTEIRHASGSTLINSLLSQEPFRLSGGTLDVATTVQVNNAFRLDGGTLRRAQVLSSAIIPESGFFSPGCTLEAVRLDSDLSVELGGHVTIVDGLTLNGVATFMGGGGGNYTTVFNFSGTQRMDGTGEVVLVDLSAPYGSAMTGIRPTSGTLTL